MNLIYSVLLNLIAVALCLGFIGFIQAGTEEEYNKDLRMKWDQLQSNQNKLLVTMNDAVDECNDTNLIVFKSNLDLYSLRRADYCILDCVLRKIDVAIAATADAYKYLHLVKILLLNYTNEAFAEESEKTTYNNAVQLYNVSYEFVKVYEFAANRCRQMLRRHEDRCESTFRFVKCILKSGRTKYDSMPLFPLSPPRDTSLLTPSTETP